MISRKRAIHSKADTVAREVIGIGCGPFEDGPLTEAIGCFGKGCVRSDSQIGDCDWGEAFKAYDDMRPQGHRGRGIVERVPIVASGYRGILHGILDDDGSTICPCISEFADIPCKGGACGTTHIPNGELLIEVSAGSAPSKSGIVIVPSDVSFLPEFGDFVNRVCPCGTSTYQTPLGHHI